jgi:hypothetical protein
MSEGRKTATLAGAAVLLAVLTWGLGPHGNPSVGFADRNSLLFPQFTDPNAATSLEIVEFDEPSATPRSFKVLNQHGRWTIPSHFDYPADARDRLAEMAAVVITLRKEDFVSVSTADYERFGVLDPLDTALPGVKGRAARITIRGENGRPLADILIGRPLAGHDDLRYVRLPTEKAVYASRVGDLKTSIRFADWIDPDLLQIDRQEIDAVNIVNYSLDEKGGTVHPREALLIRRTGDDDWKLEDTPAGQTIDPMAMDLLIGNLVGLRIGGVFPKPSGISAALGQASQSAAITTADRDDLARKGFYLTRDGRLLSNEGELIVHTKSGIFYTLRFGEVAPGEPETGAAPSGKDTTPDQRPRENRYLFIMVAFDRSSAGRAGQSGDAPERRAATLSQRFAPWYYVISAESFAQIRVQRKDLIRKAPG